MSTPAERSINITQQLVPGVSVVHVESGGVFERSAQGDIRARLPQIRSVGVADLADVLSHEIVCIVGSVSHHVRFVRGGDLRFAFNSRGELIELHSSNLAVSVSPDQRLIFSAGRRPQQ